MAYPTAELARLIAYNSDPYNASTNPYGMDDYGHIKNFPLASSDMVAVFNFWWDGRMTNAGAYDGGTAYEAGQVTRDQGSSFVALQDTTGNAPPTLPTTENTYWQLLVEKGAKGDTGDAGLDGSDGVDGADGANGSDGLDGFAPGYRFAFSTTTTDSDPGAGVVRADNATFGSITQLFIDNADAASADVTAWLDALDDSTTANHKGTLRVTASDDVAVYMDFVVTGSVVDGTGYRKVPVYPVASAGTLGDARDVVLSFQRSGDKGADGAGSGDMLAATYDPLAVGGDAFDMANMVEDTDAKVMTAAERTKLSGIAAGAQVNTVDSVAGKTGTVTLTKSDVGLADVDNTSDASKPVSTATQTALDGKLSLAGGTMTGPVMMADQLLSRAIMKDVSHEVYAIAGTSGAQTVNLENGNVQTITVTASITFTFSNWPASGDYGEVLLIVTNGSNFGSTDLDGINWVLPDGTTSTTFSDTGVTLGTYNELLITVTDAGTTKYGWVS